MVFWLLSVLALCALALAVQYQLRLRMAAGDDLVIGMSEGTWNDCVPGSSKMRGRIDRVRLTGVVVTDTDGAFTEANDLVRLKDGDLICPGLKLRLLDARQRQYFVPFANLGGLRRSGQWFWTNPFPD
ncbi:MAG: hypothetical protein A3E01_17735 [Gammaproteobacteria bacterium RIFCSPHIGHO2_12_FULL_63_22]|nr:MAG: hypothetical protein A3E01_17735 [Gammaproteobacteria bacterium RIFCSPHIGHO2_12_FULL_63_22]